MTTDSNANDAAMPVAMQAAVKRTLASSDFMECDSLPPRRRAICRGEVYGKADTNTCRIRWGLPPLDSPAAPEVSRKPTVQQPLPPLWKRAWNFVSASTQHLKAGRPKCSEEQIQARLAICEACELFDGKHCRECGCACNGSANFMNKIAWADQECPHPVGAKWGKLDGPA